MTEVDKRKISISKIVIIVLLSLILILTAAVLFFVVNENEVEGIIGIFQSNGEYTMSLDEFVVNLKPEGNARHYLKVSLALMYTDEEKGSTIESNINKIRDAIITEIRSKTYEEILADDNALILKQEVTNNINSVLGENIVKDIFITDIIIQ